MQNRYAKDWQRQVRGYSSGRLKAIEFLSCSSLRHYLTPKLRDKPKLNPNKAAYMARQTGTQFVATIGNIIGYKWMDDFYLRTKGVTKQTPEAKKQVAIFGLAVALSVKVRKALAAFMATKTDRRMMYRLNNIFAAWLRSNILNENTDGKRYLPEDFCFYGKSVNSYFNAQFLITRQAGGFSRISLPLLPALKFQAAGMQE